MFLVVYSLSMPLRMSTNDRGSQVASVEGSLLTTLSWLVSSRKTEDERQVRHCPPLIFNNQSMGDE